jgi:predicted MPP superfamily phosphohydrolase
MRKLIRAGLLMAAILLLVEFLGLYLPKYRGFLRLFTILFLVDLIFWYWNVSKGYAGKGVNRLLLTTLHYSAYLLILCSVIASLIIPFTVWPVPFRSYLVSVILILVFMKLPFLITWPGAWLAGKIRPVPDKQFLQRGRENRRLPWWLKVCWSLSVIIVAGMVYGMVIGQHDVRVRNVVVKLKDLPLGFNGYRIVQLSDIHLGSCTSKDYLSTIMMKVNTLRPDLVVVTGDLFNYVGKEGRGFESVLMNLQTKDGVFSILGNHDYGEYVSWDSEAEKKRNFNMSVEWFRTIGWELLRNEHRIINRGGDSIVIAGVENWGATKRFQRLGDVEKAIKGVEKVTTMILLSHDPSHWDSIVAKRFPEIDLTLSGHTHGGQVGFDNPLVHWSPSALIYPYWMGLYEARHHEEVQYLYVNPGIGTIGYTGRIGIEPEITLITLNRKVLPADN